MMTGSESGRRETAGRGEEAETSESHVQLANADSSWGTSSKYPMARRARLRRRPGRVPGLRTVVLVVVASTIMLAVTYAGVSENRGGGLGVTTVLPPISPPNSGSLDEKYCLKTNGTVSGSNESYYYTFSSKNPSSTGCEYDHYGYDLGFENTSSGTWSTVYVAINQTSNSTLYLNVTFTNDSVLWVKQVNNSGSFSFYSCNPSTKLCTNETGDPDAALSVQPASDPQPASCSYSAKRVAMPGYPSNYFAEMYSQCATQTIEGAIVASWWAVLWACYDLPIYAGWCAGIASLIFGAGLLYVEIADYYGHPSESGIYTAAWQQKSCFLWWCWTTTNWYSLWGNPPP